MSAFQFESASQTCTLQKAGPLKMVLSAAAAAAYSMQPSVEMGLHCAHREE